MIKIESNKLRKDTKPKINSAISNLNDAIGLLTGIEIPDDFLYSFELRGIPSQINEIAQAMGGINNYIEEKIQDFEKQMNWAPSYMQGTKNDKEKTSTDPLNWSLSYQGGGVPNKGYVGYGVLVTDPKEVQRQVKRTGASGANFFTSLLKGVAKTGEALIDTGTVAVTIPLTLITAGQDIGQNIMSGKGLKNIEFNNTKDLWSGTMSNVSEDTVDNIYKDFYEKNKYARWLDTNAYIPFKSTGVGTKIGEGLGGIAGIIGLTVLSGGAATPAMATKISTTLAGIRGFGEGTEYLWGKQRDSSWAGLERMEERGEISKEMLENYKAIRNMSEKELFDLYRFHQITQEQYDSMKQIKQMPEDWITTKNATSGLLYGTATGAWEALQYYLGNKLNGFSMKGVSALANAAMRVGIDTGFNAGDTPFRSGVESILTGRDYKKVFDEQGGLKSVLISSGVGAIGSIGGELFSSYRAKKIGKIQEEINLKANKTVAEYLVNYQQNEMQWEKYGLGEEKVDKNAIKEYLMYYIDGEKGFEKYISDNGFNILHVNDKLSVAEALGDSKLYLIESATDKLNNGELTSTQNKNLGILLNRYANTPTCELKTEQILKELSPYLGKEQIYIAKEMSEVGEIELLSRRYSKEQLRSVDEYTYTASDMNIYIDNPTAYAIESNKDKYKKIIKDLDEIIDSAKYDEVIIGYRAVDGLFDNSGERLKIEEMKPGDSFSSKRFQSASLLYEDSFAKYADRYIVIKEYISPNSGAAAYIDNVGGQNCYSQMEILTGRNKTMTLIDYPYTEKDIFGLPKIIIPVWVQ